MSKILQFKSGNGPCFETISALNKWLDQARKSQIIGVALVAINIDGSCSSGFTGVASENKNWTVGALTRLAWRVANDEVPQNE